MNIYLNHTKSASDFIFERINVMILWERFFNNGLNAAGFKTARAAHYEYIVHSSIPGMLEWWNTSIRRDDMKFVDYSARTYVFTVLFNRYDIWMLSNITITVILCCSIGTWYKYLLSFSKDTINCFFPYVKMKNIIFLIVKSD